MRSATWRRRKTDLVTNQTLVVGWGRLGSLCLYNLSSLGSNLRFSDLNRSDQIVFTLSHAIVDVAELLQDQGLAMAFISTLNGKR